VPAVLCLLINSGHFYGGYKLQAAFIAYRMEYSITPSVISNIDSEIRRKTVIAENYRVSFMM